MSAYSGSAPSWLFSFVDLAFLSLIAMTQITANTPQRSIDIGDMVVPRIGGEESTSDLRQDAPAAWQLRVYPRGDESQNPFALVRPDPGTNSVAAPVHINSTALREGLSKLMQAGKGVPLLAPHRKSMSQDLLEAAAMIEEFWPTRRRALVARNFVES